MIFSLLSLIFFAACWLSPIQTFFALEFCANVALTEINASPITFSELKALRVEFILKALSNALTLAGKFSVLYLRFLSLLVIVILQELLPPSVLKEAVVSLTQEATEEAKIQSVISEPKSDAVEASLPISQTKPELSESVLPSSPEPSATVAQPIPSPAVESQETAPIETPTQPQTTEQLPKEESLEKEVQVDPLPPTDVVPLPTVADSKLSPPDEPAPIDKPVQVPSSVPMLEPPVPASVKSTPISTPSAQEPEPKSSHSTPVTAEPLFPKDKDLPSIIHRRRLSRTMASIPVKPGPRTSSLTGYHTPSPRSPLSSPPLTANGTTTPRSLEPRTSSYFAIPTQNGTGENMGVVSPPPSPRQKTWNRFKTTLRVNKSEKDENQNPTAVPTKIMKEAKANSSTETKRNRSFSLGKVFPLSADKGSSPVFGKKTAAS